MKTTGVLILVTGFLIVIFTTFGLMEERVVGGDLLRITPHTIHSQIWEPLVGAIVVMIGAWIVISRRKGAPSLSR
jgi:hypothetical protein